MGAVAKVIRHPRADHARHRARAARERLALAYSEALLELVEARRLAELAHRFGHGDTITLADGVLRMATTQADELFDELFRAVEREAAA